MVWALLPLLLISFIMGFTAIERDLASVNPPAAPSEVNAATAAGQEFMLYRNAVMTYVQQKELAPYNAVQNFVVSQSLLHLTQAELNALPSGAIAVAVANQTPSTSSLYGTQSVYGPGYTICVWMPVPAGTVEQTVAQLGGDLTIGTVMTTSTWVQAAAGGPNGPGQKIPPLCIAYAAMDGAMPPPTPQTGYMISVVGLGGN